MKIETEFNRGDHVFFPSLNFTTILDAKIMNVRAVNEKVEYEMDNLMNMKVPEQFIASTREALKAKLVDNVNKLFEG